MKKLITTLAFLGLCSIASATSITFNAGTANGISGFGNASLAPTDLVEIGTWDGATFLGLGSSAPDNLSSGNGLFSGEVATFASAAGAQLAYRWSEAASGATGIIFYDIAFGGAKAAEWTLKGGDGTGSDFNQNIIDVADLTTGSGDSYAVLDAGAVLIGAAFAGPNGATGAPNFSLVPEPSTYAALAGMLALSFVMVRRRRA
jgi:hypothetical protein